MVAALVALKFASVLGLRSLIGFLDAHARMRARFVAISDRHNVVESGWHVLRRHSVVTKSDCFTDLPW
jgi:hypothetical protein